MKKTKNFVALILALIMLCSCSVVAFANTNQNDVEYIPLWMEPHSVIIYDANGNPTVVEGGYLSAEDIVGRDDIAAVGLTDNSPDMIVTPNTKVEYDMHGFIQNIYYLTPGTTNQYQLSNPMRSRIGSGIMSVGTYTYPQSYYNYDTGSNQYCKLTRTSVAGSYYDTMVGYGRITFYTGLNGEGSTTYFLKEDDCATKMSYDDVKDGTKILATNLYNGKWHYYEKHDVGSMPKAILDIWSDSTVNPITKISTNGRIDNVYSGKIEHAVIPYD